MSSWGLTLSKNLREVMDSLMIALSLKLSTKFMATEVIFIKNMNTMKMKHIDQALIG